jgi:hypothetical protein
MTACPQGQSPQRVKTGKKGGQIVHFDKAVCDSCPRQSDCPVKRVKHSATLRYDAKALRLARRRARQKTQAFGETYRFRAGAEATMSDLDRITEIKHLRVRGMPQVRLAVILKATGLNILRATAFRNRLKRKNKSKTGPIAARNGFIEAVKEQFRRSRDYLRPFSQIFFPGNCRTDCFMPEAA